MASNTKLIDFKNVKQGTILRTYEEMEAYFRSSTRQITEVIIHDTDTTKEQGVEYSDMYYLDTDRGLSDVCYHFMILRNGQLQVCRPISKDGEHCVNHNRYSIGIALVGGKLGTVAKPGLRSERSFTRGQMATLDAFMKAFYNVIPGGQAWGHKDIEPQKRSDPLFDVPGYVSKRFNKYNTQTVEEARSEGSLSVEELIAKMYAS